MTFSALFSSRPLFWRPLLTFTEVGRGTHTEQCPRHMPRRLGSQVVPEVHVPASKMAFLLCESPPPRNAFQPLDGGHSGVE